MNKSSRADLLSTIENGKVYVTKNMVGVQKNTKDDWYWAGYMAALVTLETAILQEGEA